MRIFVTGGTGYVGSAITSALVGAGHQVTGLVRSQASAKRLQALGGRPLLGDIHDPGSYSHSLSGQDGMIHMAFDYAGDTVEADRATLETFLAAAREADGARVIVYTSGCWVVGETGDEPADEDAAIEDPAEIVAWRPAHEELALEAATDSLATAAIRPGIVYGGSGGITAGFFDSAVDKGAAEYVGGGDNRWTLVHREDLGRLYLLAVERAARGVLHGVDESPITVKEMAAAASRAAGAGGATKSIPLERAREAMGGMADALCLDQALVAPRARELGWKPQHPSFPQSAQAAYAEWKQGR